MTFGEFMLLVAGIFILAWVIFSIAHLIELNKNPEEFSDSHNKRTAWALFIIIYIGGMLASAYSVWYYLERKLPEPAAVQGVWIQTINDLNVFATGIVFLITTTMLFVYIVKYYGRKGRRAAYIPGKIKVEMAIVSAVAIGLMILIVPSGLYWFRIMSPAPEDAVKVEVTGYQFAWIFRYPGPDGKFGKRDWRLISPDNPLGIDPNDPAGHDDIVTTEFKIPVNKPVALHIRSKDVIHSFFIPFFRMKMDAVPGVPTFMWFTPKYTTEEMREKTGNESFVYEVACAELCGSGHSSMRTTLDVVEPQEFEQWLNKQTAWYETYTKNNKSVIAESQQK